MEEGVKPSAAALLSGGFDSVWVRVRRVDGQHSGRRDREGQRLLCQKFSLTKRLWYMYSTIPIRACTENRASRHLLIEKGF